jgi:hypothetical protein
VLLLWEIATCDSCFDLSICKDEQPFSVLGRDVLDDQATQRYPSIDACNGLDTDAALFGLASDWMPERIVRDLGVSAPANLGRRFASENDAYSLAASESSTKQCINARNRWDASMGTFLL